MMPSDLSAAGRCPGLILLAGPTAVGKSEVAMLLAERWHGEIVSVDSMQVYRGLDIGTAKPTAAERARIPHHLLDVAEPGEAFDAAKFVTLARAAVQQIQARGRLPILCGGTGLYFKAFLEGLGAAPPSDPALRAELEATPRPRLLRELAERDPVAFARIDQQNPRRIIRAIEVIRLTGKPFSSQRAAWKTTDEPRGAARASPLLALWRQGADLRARIDRRVDQMFERGLVAETKQLLPRGLAENKTAMQALGYRQVVEYLRGARSLAETIALVKQRTRHFARRQITWLRHQLPATWLECQPGETAADLAARLESHFPSGN